MPGSVPEGWRRLAIEEMACQRAERIRPSRDDQTPYVALEHIPNGGGRLLGVDVAGSAMSHKTRFRAGDTLFGKLRPNLRKVVRVRFDGVCSTDILAVAPKDGTDAAFLYQLLASDVIYRHVMGDITGTKMPRTSWERLADLSVSCPPLPEQRAIAAVLDAVDDTIERTEAVIAATEALRRSLLHELLTRGVPGMHSEWKHVPGLGTVPACWEVTTLGEVCGVASGFAMGPSRAPKDSPRPYLTVANVHTDRVSVEHVRYMELTDAEYASRSLQTGDLVMVEGHAQVSQLGRAAIVPPEADGYTFQNHLFRVRLRTAGDLRYVSAFINGPRGRDYFASFGGTTSGLNTVSAGNVRLLPVSWPSPAEQQRIAEVLAAVDDSLTGELEQSGTLRAVKEATADALLTGRARLTP